MVLYCIPTKSVFHSCMIHRATASASSKSNSRSKIGVERTLCTEELSRDVQGLASHNDDLLAIEQLLSHGTGQAT